MATKGGASGAPRHKVLIGILATLLLLLGITILILALVIQFNTFDFEDLRTTPFAANVVSGILVVFSIISGLVAIAAALAGHLHFHHYRPGSMAAASGLALLAWLASIVTLIFASKQIQVGGSLNSRLKALEALDIILAFFTTLYVLALHGGLFNSAYGTGY